MPLQIIRNDITKVCCDAIVNAANSTLLGGGGVDGAIHRAAGPQLLMECRTLGGCSVGDAKITNAYNLPARYVIHTVGPIWYGGSFSEDKLLASCYKRSLAIALQYGCESVAFPLISAGAYGYPKDLAFKVAVDTISNFVLQHDMMVYLVVFDNSAVTISKSLYADLKEYIDDNYVDYTEKTYPRSVALDSPCFNDMASTVQIDDVVPTLSPMSEESHCQECKLLDDSDDLKKRLCYLDESFSEMLLRKIDESGMKDSECYKKANIDRKLFSKIRSNPAYKPSKPTVLAFCIALELSLKETQEMLLKAGFALSHSNKFDVIVEYFIDKGIYNIFTINETLFAFDQSLLG